MMIDNLGDFKAKLFYQLVYKMNEYTTMNAKLNILHQMKQIRQSMSPSVSNSKRKSSLTNQSGRLKKLKGGKKRTKRKTKKRKLTMGKRRTITKLPGCQ